MPIEIEELRRTFAKHVEISMDAALMAVAKQAMEYGLGCAASKSEKVGPVVHIVRAVSDGTAPAMAVRSLDCKCVIPKLTA